MNKYKLIACDLDGTLLDKDLRISKENLSAIAELSRRGVYFVPATGRAISEMPEIIENPDIRYVIYSNGAGMLDTHKGKDVFACISPEASCFVLDVISKYESYFVAHRAGETYGELLDRRTRDEFNVSFNVQELVDKYCNLGKDMAVQLRSMDEVESYSVFFKNPSDKQLCKEELMADRSLRVVDSFASNIEIFCAGAGKDVLLKRLCSTLGIDMKDVITVGDSGNDIAMTKIAGLGLAVSNGGDSIKAVAHEVICSNNEHAIKYICEKYFNE